MKTAFFLFSAMLTLAGCATLDKQKLGDASIRVPLDPLALDIDYDVYLLRADLNRSTHIETRTTTQPGLNGATYTMVQNVSVPDAYHYVAVDLGNGIIFDYNHNLCLDLARFYGLSDKANFKVTKEASGFLGSTTTFLKQGDMFTSTDHALLGGTRKAFFAKGAVTINEPGILGAKPKLTVNAASIDYNPDGFLGLGAITISKPDASTVIIPGFWSKEVFRKLDDNHVSLGSALEVTSQGDTLQIRYNGLFGVTTDYTFFRTETGCLFFNSQSKEGIEVQRHDNRISVFRNGTLVDRYTIDQES